MQNKIVKFDNKLQEDLRNLTICGIFNSMIFEVQIVFSDTAPLLNSHMKHLFYEITRASSLDQMVMAFKGISTKKVHALVAVNNEPSTAESGQSSTKQSAEEKQNIQTLNLEGGAKVYVGTVVNGKMEGRGTCTYTKNSEFKFYDGEWKNHTFWGQGKLTYVDNCKGMKQSYVGKFENGEITEGKMVWTDGTYFEGLFKNDKCLKGKMTYTANDSEYKLYYNGEFLLGTLKRHGWGEMFYDGTKRSDSVIKYVGQWDNDDWHGRGITFYVSGNILDGPMDHNTRTAKTKRYFKTQGGKVYWWDYINGGDGCQGSYIGCLQFNDDPGKGQVTMTFA